MKPVDEQLALIKQGCQEIIREEDLKARLQEAIATGKPCGSRPGSIPPPRTCTWGTRCSSRSSSTSRTWATR